MQDIFENINSDYDSFTLFQDEAGCESSNFFYHGYLLVDNKFGRQILDEVLKIKGAKSKDSEITFKEIKKDDYRTRIAIKWLVLADELLRSGKIRFYVLGVNKNNLKNFWDNSWRFNKNVYLRFFEIGLNSLSGWFKKDPSLQKPLHITHLFYEYGPYNDERKNKISWLKSLSGYENAEPVYSDSRTQREKNKKLFEMSNLIQLTDVMLGVAKYSFIKINDNYVGRQRCIDCFIDIIEKFNDKKNAYNTKSQYYKRYSLNFFPTKTDITKKEFLSNNWESIRKKGGFYIDRKTCRQEMVESKNLRLF